MNDGFLFADCVFDFLFKADFIHYAEWKHNTKELYYTVSFLQKGTRASIVVFDITVLNEQHIITKSSIRIIEQRFMRDFSRVFTDCAVA